MPTPCRYTTCRLALISTVLVVVVVGGVQHSSSIELCELPPCDLVLQSRLHSERCGSKAEGWPLLLTGTPRSATVFASKLLQGHGMLIHNDWGAPERDGSVSWIFAFEDPNNFGPARTQGKTFGHVLHQVKDPLGSITSMCTEPVYTGELKFLQRHINFTSSLESPRSKSRGVLEFWVRWHTFLKEMKFPTYQIEQVEAEDIFRIAGLEQLYHNRTSKGVVSSSTNARDHRDRFSWQQIYTIDPDLAAEAWNLAHYYGYSYPGVSFDNLTCLDFLPMCEYAGSNNIPPPKCLPGTYPPFELGEQRSRSTNANGLKGWVDVGCTEYKLTNGTFVGLTGARAKEDPVVVTNEFVELLMQNYMHEVENEPRPTESLNSSNTLKRNRTPVLFDGVNIWGILLLGIVPVALFVGIAAIISQFQGKYRGYERLSLPHSAGRASIELQSVQVV
jgi:hypothetical protein